MKTPAGFTLIELVCVIAVMSIGLVGVSRLFQQTREGPLYAAAVQNATQLAQECAEYALDTKRAGKTVTTSLCDSMPKPTGYNRTLTPSSITTSSCPTGGTCTYWNVTVTAPAESSTVTTSAVVMLVQY
jgi:prepilin-type N-terminal cleavage/methylation domain-containing protein